MPTYFIKQEVNFHNNCITTEQGKALLQQFRTSKAVRFSYGALVGNKTH